MSDNFSELKGDEKQEGSIQPNWIAGAVIIVVGIVLLLRNVTGFEFDNWWALFMFIPFGGLLAGMWNQYQVNGRVPTGLIISGISMAFVMSIFLFNLSWSALWPVFFIIGGISALLGSRK
jgi:hypothetical protein